MESKDFNGLDLTYYKEVLNNGLEVYLIPMSNKKNYYINYATKFGSDITNFVPIDKKEEVIVPDGIAHFLEHKMFEQESGEDPFTFFSTSGTDSNAMTDYTSTQYICTGTKKFKENLEYLLQFVNSPYYTDENVEKEKGIIAEELKMYNDVPDYKLEMRLRECIYESSPRRVDIGGSVNSIQDITKEDLYLCYENFYNPSNMFVLVVGNFDVDEALTIIKDNTELIDKKGIAKRIERKEKKKVNIEEDTIYSDINVPKLGIGLKIPSNDKDKLMTSMYLKMIFTCFFGSTSLFRDRVDKMNLIQSFDYDIENYDDIYTLYIICSSLDIDSLLSEIKKELKSKKIKEADFNRIKKVWIANEVKAYDDLYEVVDRSSRDVIKYGDIIDDRVDKIKNMTLKKLNSTIKSIDFNNLSVVRMERKEN